MSRLMLGSRLARLEARIRDAYAMARERKDYAAVLAEQWLGQAHANIDAAAVAFRAAVSVEGAARAEVVAALAQCRARTAWLGNEMWFALERSVRGRHMVRVFPRGVAGYDAKSLPEQLTLLRLLESRMLACNAPELEDRRKPWAEAIATARAALEDAVKRHEAELAEAKVAAAAYRLAVNSGHEALRAFKRGLRRLALPETDIRQIVPSGGRTRATSSARSDRG